MTDCAAQVDAWLEPLGDPPCGEDLEYDNEFLDLAKAAEGKPETQFSQAEPPDWTRVNELTESLFGRTRDIRLAMFWARTQMHRDGLIVLPHALRLMRELLSRYWDDVHPKPDPDDGDPYARLNVLAQLEDANTLLGDVRQAAIVRSRAIGQLTVRDLELALELIPAREDESPMPASAVRQMLEAAVAENESLRDLPTQIREELEGLTSLLNERAGYGRAPECETLKSILSGLSRVMPSADGGAGLDDLLGELGMGDAQSAGVAAVRASRGGGLGDSVESREDAIKAIDLVCAFLERTEPTNPAQMLLRRAQRLIDKNFLELVKELAPDALNEVAKIMGVDPSSVAGGNDDGY